MAATDPWSIGIKEYSEWPTIPQLYVDKEFVGGCDILVAMHQNGELAKMLEEKKVLVPAEGETPKYEMMLVEEMYFKCTKSL